jgi:hypothetical protein
MTDRTPDRPADGPDEMEVRLERHFTTEVRRAERDVRREWFSRPVPPGPVSRPRRRAGIVAGAAVVVFSVTVAIVALGQAPARVPPVGGSPLASSGTSVGPAASATASVTASGVAQASPAVSASPTAGPVDIGGSYPDGIPRTIDGRPVLRPAVAETHAAATTDDTPFLVGGWATQAYRFCSFHAIDMPSPFLWCSPNFLGEKADVGILEVAPDRTDIPLGRVVLEVHTHDVRAADCVATDRVYCRAALVVDAVVWQGSAPSAPVVTSRYPDGIPSSLGGEAVLRPASAIAQASAATDDSSFFVGGWRRGPVAYSCPAVLSGSVTPNPLAPGCGGYIIDDLPMPDPTEAQIRLVPFGVALPADAGPAVFLVHVHDRRAAGCTTDVLTACDRAFVVDGVVWTGDATTATAPLTIQDVLRRLAGVAPGLSATPHDPTNGIDAGCDPGWPAQSWTISPSVAGVDTIGRILVFRKPADALVVAARLTLSGFVGRPDASGTSCTVTFDSALGSSWLVQDNVVVEIRVPVAFKRSTAFLDAVRHWLATDPGPP